MDIVEPDLSRLDKLNLEAALFKDLPRDVCETDFLKDHLQEMMMLKDEQEKVLKRQVSSEQKKKKTLPLSTFCGLLINLNFLFYFSEFYSFRFF